ncbi:hypothetical protein PENTCL1PPCAC_7907 [Pristionchus entomophagus]|uniref:Uncharacterized protein n=1 Tax=Pristionchus entomophagus TaxID=358040 RepID=A0AAV5SSH4_9BILA|nr:hypothetical protein PENTCL1PPCAC_7907 [Pristionchus entomophagus]
MESICKCSLSGESPWCWIFTEQRRKLTLNNFDAAEINFNALRDFMIRVYPNYSDRDFFSEWRVLCRSLHSLPSTSFVGWDRRRRNDKQEFQGFFLLLRTH